MRTTSVWPRRPRPLSHVLIRAPSGLGEILRSLWGCNRRSRQLDHSLREEKMTFTGNFLGIAMLSLVFTASAGAQAPQVEKNVSMKMALMIIEGTLEQCTKDGYKVS